MNNIIIKGMVSCRSTRSSFANEAVYTVCIYQFSTLTLMWHAYRQTDTDRDSNIIIIIIVVVVVVVIII